MGNLFLLCVSPAVTIKRTRLAVFVAAVHIGLFLSVGPMSVVSRLAIAFLLQLGFMEVSRFRLAGSPPFGCCLLLAVITRDVVYVTLCRLGIILQIGALKILPVQGLILLIPTFV